MDLNFSMEEVTANAETRTISGRVVTWGEEGNTSAGATIFAKDSITFAKKTKLLLEHDRTRPIGTLKSYEVTDTGVQASFHVANTSAGSDALVEASSGLRDGFSVGVTVDSWENKSGVMLITAAKLREISLVTEPAIASARVENVAASENEVSEATQENTETQSEGEQVSDTTVPATPAVEEAVEAAATTPEVTVTANAPVTTQVRLRTPIVDGASYLEHSIKASLGDRESAQFVSAANDTTTNTGLTLPQHMQEFISTDIGGRAAVDAISTAALPASGLSFTIPVIDQVPTWDAPVAEGAAPTVDEVESSYMTVDIKKAFTSQNISWELLDRSSPAFYAELLALLGKAYARKTDALVVAALTAGGTAATVTTADADGLQNFIGTEAAAAYAGSGSFARNLLVNSSHWSNIMKFQDSAGRPLYVASNPANNPGAVSGNSLSGSVLGMNLLVDAHIASGTGDNTAFLIAPDAATFYEGPRTQISVQNLGDGSVTVGMYNYYAIAVKKAAGIRKWNVA